MTAALAAGCLAALGLFLVARGLLPPRPRLAVVLDRVYGDRQEPISLAPAPGPLARGVGGALSDVLEAIGLQPASLRANLAVLGRSVEDHTAVRLGSALGLGIAAAVLPIALAVIGTPLPGVVAGGVVVCAAIGGFALADGLARQEAARRRREFRLGLAFFLDLMIVVLSGGGGPATAVRLASEAGQGWVYAQLRDALMVGRIRRQEPWDVLAALGAEFDVVELEELAASVAMAERQGASVRQSLGAKAGAIRDRQAAEEEARAKAATIRMALPLVLLGIGFAALLLFGATMSLFKVTA